MLYLAEPFKCENIHCQRWVNQREPFEVDGKKFRICLDCRLYITRYGKLRSAEVVNTAEQLKKRDQDVENEKRKRQITEEQERLRNHNGVTCHNPSCGKVIADLKWVSVNGEGWFKLCRDCLHFASKFEELRSTEKTESLEQHRKKNGNEEIIGTCENPSCGSKFRLLRQVTLEGKTLRLCTACRKDVNENRRLRTAESEKEAQRQRILKENLFLEVRKKELTRLQNNDEFTCQLCGHVDKCLMTVEFKQEGSFKLCGACWMYIKPWSASVVLVRSVCWLPYCLLRSADITYMRTHFGHCDTGICMISDCGNRVSQQEACCGNSSVLEREREREVLCPSCCCAIYNKQSTRLVEAMIKEREFFGRGRPEHCENPNCGKGRTQLASIYVDENRRLWLCKNCYCYASSSKSLRPVDEVTLDDRFKLDDCYEGGCGCCEGGCGCCEGGCGCCENPNCCVWASLLPTEVDELDYGPLGLCFGCAKYANEHQRLRPEHICDQDWACKENFSEAVQHSKLWLTACTRKVGKTKEKEKHVEEHEEEEEEEEKENDKPLSATETEKEVDEIPERVTRLDDPGPNNSTVNVEKVPDSSVEDVTRSENSEPDTSDSVAQEQPRGSNAETISSHLTTEEAEERPSEAHAAEAAPLSGEVEGENEFVEETEEAVDVTRSVEFEGEDVQDEESSGNVCNVIDASVDAISNMIDASVDTVCNMIDVSVDATEFSNTASTAEDSSHVDDQSRAVATFTGRVNELTKKAGDQNTELKGVREKVRARLESPRNSEDTGEISNAVDGSKKFQSLMSRRQKLLARLVRRLVGSAKDSEEPTQSLQPSVSLKRQHADSLQIVKRRRMSPRSDEVEEELSAPEDLSPSADLLSAEEALKRQLGMD